MYNLKNFLPYSYRTDLENADWRESIVIFGCSMVYGEGLELEDTIPYHINKQLNVPVVNMGVIGSSMYFSLYNQMVLKNISQPKAVINIWTEYSRIPYFKTDRVDNYGPWNIGKNNFGDLWTTDNSNAVAHALMIQQSSKALWKEIPYYEATFFKPTQAILNCDQLLGHATKDDYAKDRIHPGPIATKMCADYIISRANFS
jgi:hypothetical protein